jgi:hypothetical protein
MNLTKEQILEEELSEDILEIIEQKDKPEELRYFKRYILDAMERYAQQQVKNLNIPAVVGRSEQLVCPYCKGKNIEIRHREQSFRCIDCKEGWAN